MLNFNSNKSFSNLKFFAKFVNKQFFVQFLPIKTKKLSPLIRNLKDSYFSSELNLWDKNQFSIYKNKAFKNFNNQKDQDPYSTKRLLQKITGLINKKMVINYSNYNNHAAFFFISAFKKQKIYVCLYCGQTFIFNHPRH